MIKIHRFTIRIALIVGVLPTLLSGPRAAAQTNSSPSAQLPPLVAQGRVATLDSADLVDFDRQPAAIQHLIRDALALTRLGLSYRYGSDDPASGGMDCSGTIFHLLEQAGISDPPRDSGEMYRWVWTQGYFQAVVSGNPDTFELSRLRPGDLLFWADTYQVKRDPPVSHVMIYLGVNRLTGRRVMMGASEGRRFNDVSRYGVSVFDFVLPHASDSETTSHQPTPRFIGYGSIPGLPDTPRQTP